MLLLELVQQKALRNLLRNNSEDDLKYKVRLGTEG